MKSIYFILFFFFCIHSKANKIDTVDQNDTFLIERLQKRLNDSNDLMLNSSDNLSSIHMASNLFALQQLNKTRNSLEHLLIKLKKEKQKSQNKAKVKKILNNSKNSNNSKPSSNSSKDDEATLGLPPKSSYYDYNEEDRLMNLLKLCAKGFLLSLPTHFCVKNPVEVGTSDVKCLSGDTDFNSYCWEACPPSYDFQQGMCIQQCQSGYQIQVGLYCYKSLFNWYFQKTTVPNAYTKFDSRAQCLYPKVKFSLDEPLCFSNCNDIGYLNCDDQTCATNSFSHKLCGNPDIFSVIDNILTGTNSFFLEQIFLDADGLFSPFFDDISRFQDLFPVFRNILTDSLSWIKNWIDINQDLILNQTISKTHESILNNDYQYLYQNDSEIQSQCSLVNNIFYAKISQTSTVSQTFSDFNYDDLSNILQSCNLTNENYLIDCPIAINDSVSKWDPTFILGILSVFGRNSCPQIKSEN